MDGVQGLLGVDAAGGVVGGGQNDGLGLFIDSGLQGLRVHLEVVVLRGQVHGHAPAQPGDGGVQAEGRRGDDDLIAGIQHGGKRDMQALGGADGQDDLLGVIVQAVFPLLEFGDGLQHIGIAVAGRIVGVIGVQRGLGRLLHHVRGILVRLTDGQGTGTGGIPHQEGKPADTGQFLAEHGVIQLQFHASHAPKFE